MLDKEWYKWYGSYLGYIVSYTNQLSKDIKGYVGENLVDYTLMHG